MTYDLYWLSIPCLQVKSWFLPVESHVFILRTCFRSRQIPQKPHETPWISKFPSEFPRSLTLKTMNPYKSPWVPHGSPWIPHESPWIAAPARRRSLRPSKWRPAPRRRRPPPRRGWWTCWAPGTEWKGDIFIWYMKFWKIYCIWIFFKILDYNDYNL